MPMGSGESKLRIIWICHFMNHMIHEKLGLTGNVRQEAPWISLGLEEIRKRNDIELHIIAPFIQLRKNRQFSEPNIHYHCIKVGVPLLKRDWPRRFKFNVWTNFLFFNLQVEWLVKRIAPHLVNLQGAENAYYSSSILKIKKIPAMVTIQGFVTLDNQNDTRHPYERKRLEVEKEILTKLRYFGVEDSSIERYIRTFNPDARMFWFHYPFAKTNIRDTGKKEYDLVFFARILKMKGIEDLIEAVALVRKSLPAITLCIIGKGLDTYIEFLRTRVTELGLEENIIFRGFMPTQKEMHIQVVKARISVLPTYNDTIPGTIVESMLLGIPVISYRTGGIPDLNKTGEHIVLLDQGDVKGLADQIVQLLANEQRQQELASASRQFAEFEFDNARSVELMVQAYKDVIKDFNHG
jgi:glycosyltransferase involved in cell wall biosynthesis